MSVVDPSVTAAGVTAIFTVMIMYVVDWIADQREKAAERKIAANGSKGTKQT